MTRPGLAAVLATALLTTPAAATTGWGCWFPLGQPTVHEDRSAESRVVVTISIIDPPIISGGVDKADAEARCLPHSVPSAERWCPVALFFPDKQERGFVERRYLTHSECP